MMEAYKRLRHTYGFGVHSPYAFDMVRMVIRPGRYGFYGYTDIELALGDSFSHSIRSEARMLLRLASFLNCRSAFIPNGAHPAFYAALRAVSKSMDIIRKSKDADSCDLVCASGSFFAPDVLEKLLRTSGKALALRDVNPELLARLFASLPSGLMLYGKRNAIIISREGMQKVAYSMIL